MKKPALTYPQWRRRQRLKRIRLYALCFVLAIFAGWGCGDLMHILGRAIGGRLWP